MGKSVRIAHKVNGAEIASFMIADGVATLGTFTCEDMAESLSVARYLFTSDDHPSEGPDYAARVEKAGSKWRVHITVTYADGGAFHTLYWTAGEFSGTRGTALYRAFLAMGAACREGGAVRAQLETERAERIALARQLLTFRVEGEPVSGPTDDERAELIERERERREARQTGVCEGTGKAPAPGTRVQRDDHTVSVPDDYNGKHSAKCPECPRVIAVNRAGAMRRHNAPKGAPVDPPAVREDSAPVQGELFTGATGRTYQEMRDAVAAYYAAGNPVPVEVSSLPDPARVRVNWSGTDAGDSGAVVRCDFKGDVEIINPEKTHGKCPECRAYIPLQDVKSNPDANRIGGHNRYGVATPAHAGLSSRAIETVEHGSVPGDPGAADKRRGTESRCDRTGRVVRNSTGGEKKCTGCARTVELVSAMRMKKGEWVKVWLYPRHYRPVTEELTVDSFRRAGADGRAERKVTPRGSGADAGKGQRDHGTVDGSANTGRQNLAPVLPKGWLAKAGTMSLPATVRPGVDPEVTGDICPVCEERVDIAHAGKSKSWRRNHSKRLRAYWEARDAERKARREADIAAGRIIPSAVRRELRKAASIGSFAEGTVAGRVAHGGERPAVKPVLTPRGMTRAGK